MKHLRTILALLAMLLFPLSGTAGYTDFLTAQRGFTEVTSIDDIVPGADNYYILASAENTDLVVGVGRYEAKPGWASEESKALRYFSTDTDPALVMSNFFTIEKSDTYIGFRNVVYNSDLFQTHDNAGYMYVNTFTDANLDEWSYLTPTFQDGYWLFESGKYPISSDNWACGYLGPWNNRVAVGEPLALNRRNTTDDEAGHYRLFHITKTDLEALREQRLHEMGEASDSHPVDATWLIVNPSFEMGDETGWTLIGKDPNGNEEFKVRGDYGMTNKHDAFLLNAYQWWASNLGVSQTVTNVPSGIYELSAVVCTWAGRTVTFTGNGNTVSTEGGNDATGIPVSMTVEIGNDQTLAISAGSTGAWWVSGHEGETQTFFKLDNVRLNCKGLFLNAVAQPLPNDETTILDPGQWYYYDVAYSTEYLLIGNLDGMVYSINEDVVIPNVTTGTPTREMTLTSGRVYFKTTSSDATLLITQKREMEQGSFTAVALNVDGLPNTVAGVNLNPDGPGSDGTKKISQYMLSKGYDIIGASEDFNYNGSLMEFLEGYSCGTVRSTLSLWELAIPFDTDGLNLIWKNSKISTANEDWKRWKSSKSGEGNEYVKKGYRHYDVTIDGKYVIDVYILHMDAGSEEYAASREGQWRQLAEAINLSDLTRPKLVIGDTNSRWTREDIGANFTNLLSSQLTMSDVWVELCRGNVYPTTDMGDITDQSDPANFSNYEVVDKIIYINPTAPNTLQLQPQSFRIEQDYTYDYIDHNGNTNPLGDHRPVVVEFTYTKSGDVEPLNITLVDDSEANSKTIADASGLTANVQLSGRTLQKGGLWNTLCLPFNLTSEQIQNSPLAGATIKTLSDATVTGYNVELTFGSDETSITAETPYIVKWAQGDNIADVTFENVTLVNSTEAERTIEKCDGHVKFIGYYDAFVIKPEENPTLYYLGSDDKFKYTAKERTLNACRAYFQLASSLGDVNGDGIISVSDVTLLVSHILGNQDDGFILENADTNIDGTISVSDVTTLVNMILNSGNQFSVVVHGADGLTLDYVGSGPARAKKVED